mmetsp:Transcript_4367/g.10557  ORF Transcript_4367/g.10557 Transcript_4367/m.10557 type:complete len:202 (+) Transcript_4367:377-982(+)
MLGDLLPRGGREHRAQLAGHRGVVLQVQGQCLGGGVPGVRGVRCVRRCHGGGAAERCSGSPRLVQTTGVERSSTCVVWQRHRRRCCDWSHEELLGPECGSSWHGFGAPAQCSGGGECPVLHGGDRAVEIPAGEAREAAAEASAALRRVEVGAAAGGHRAVVPGPFGPIFVLWQRRGFPSHGPHKALVSDCHVLDGGYGVSV